MYAVRQRLRVVPAFISPDLRHNERQRKQAANHPQPLDRARHKILTIRWVQKYQCRLLDRSQPQDIACDDRAARLSATGRDVRPKRVESRPVLLNEDSPSSPPRERFQSKRPGSGKKIQHHRVLNRGAPAPRCVYQHVEQRLPRAVGCRTRRTPRGRLQDSPPPSASHDPHSVPSSPGRRGRHHI